MVCSSSYKGSYLGVVKELLVNASSVLRARVCWLLSCCSLRACNPGTASYTNCFITLREASKVIVLVELVFSDIDEVSVKRTHAWIALLIAGCRTAKTLVSIPSGKVFKAPTAFSVAQSWCESERLATFCCCWWLLESILIFCWRYWSNQIDSIFRLWLKCLKVLMFLSLISTSKLKWQKTASTWHEIGLMREGHNHSCMSLLPLATLSKLLFSQILTWCDNLHV